MWFGEPRRDGKGARLAVVDRRSSLATVKLAGAPGVIHGTSPTVGFNQGVDGITAQTNPFRVLVWVSTGIQYTFRLKTFDTPLPWKPAAP